jgi:hypothetical protein
MPVEGIENDLNMCVEIIDGLKRQRFRNRNYSGGGKWCFVFGGMESQVAFIDDELGPE